MRRSRIMGARVVARAVGAALVVVVAVPAASQSASPNDALPVIRQFDIPTIEKLGREMYEQDQFAWKATDIALAHFTEEGLRSQKTHGWIVETTPAGSMVRFVHDTPDGSTFFYDVTFPASGAPSASIPDNTTLNADEKAQYDARILAIANIKPNCSNRYNTIILKDPQGNGWLVWVMAATTDPQSIVIGGHYRFTISADGKTVIQKDALSKSCMTMKKPATHDGELEDAAWTQIVSTAPLETAVFASLSYKIPLFVGTLDSKVWKFDGDEVTNVDMDSPGVAGSAARYIAGLMEDCRIIETKIGETPEKYYLQDSVDVINATEKDSPFKLTPSAGYQAASVTCGRRDFVPAPNDYKVVLAGYPLIIIDTGVGHPKRTASLEIVGGRFQFRQFDGERPSDDLKSRIGARLDSFQNIVQAKP
jgi:hypothetical protein